MAHIGWLLLTAAMLGVLVVFAIASIEERCDLLRRLAYAIVFWCAAHAMAATAVADVVLWGLGVPAPSTFASALVRGAVLWTFVIGTARLAERAWHSYAIVALATIVVRVV